MKKLFLLMVLSSLIVSSCAKKTAEMPVEVNPLLSDYGTPFETPPFDRIKEEHFLPAYQEGMNQHNADIAAIIGNPDAPTFENTIVALDNSGSLLTKVDNLFNGLRGANTNDEIQRIAKEVTPLLSKHFDNITLNAEIFARVKAVYDRKDSLDLSVEQSELLDKFYKDFVRNGANLDGEKQARLREINEELSLLSLSFGENILKEDNAFELVIEEEEDLSGLPENVVAGAAEAARERGHEGKWVFTLHKPSLIPFLQYSDKRQLREKIFAAYINRGNNGNEMDNKTTVSRMAALRAERAQLLGYETHAHYVLEENMAKQPESVYRLLNQLWVPALKKAKTEAEDLRSMIAGEGHEFELEPWDWWYNAQKVKKAKFDLDEEVLRPYFKLENVIEGVFNVASELFDIRFVARDDISVYHEDVKVFEVKNADGTHVGILYTDYFPRSSKRGGAWMNSLRKQSIKNGKKVTPLIYNVGNFSKPTADKPSLLSFDEVLTLFHEFGHALHGLLSDCTYETLSGTSVARDFVELPSQIMENWASHPEVLKTYARHYETGEPIPQDLIDKMKKASFFNQGFAAVEYLAASFLDMDWHTLSVPEEKDCLEFEEKSMNRIGLMPEIVVRYRSPYFSHIFAGGYSSGYYSYVWAEVLDADAFEAFKEKGIFDQETAQSFRKNILEAGGTEDPMVLYKRFRGAEPTVEPVLRRKGLIPSTEE